MACCALAAFIVSQLLVALDWLRESMGLTPAASAQSAAAAWRLGDALPAPAHAAPAFASPRRIALAFGGGALAFAFAYSAIEAGGEHRPHALQIPYLCTSGAPLALR
jgi:hypothetical protein